MLHFQYGNLADNNFVRECKLLLFTELVRNITNKLGFYLQFSETVRYVLNPNQQ